MDSLQNLYVEQHGTEVYQQQLWDQRRAPAGCGLLITEPKTKWLMIIIIIIIIVVVMICWQCFLVDS